MKRTFASFKSLCPIVCCPILPNILLVSTTTHTIFFHSCVCKVLTSISVRQGSDSLIQSNRSLSSSSQLELFSIEHISYHNLLFLDLEYTANESTQINKGQLKTKKEPLAKSQTWSNRYISNIILKRSLHLSLHHLDWASSSWCFTLISSFWLTPTNQICLKSYILNAFSPLFWYLYISFRSLFFTLFYDYNHNNNNA